MTDFKTCGYIVIRNFLEPSFVSFIQQYFYTRIRANHSTLGDPQAPHSHSFYGDPLIETLLETSSKSLGEHAGLDLLPSYSYSRLYQMGDELVIHKDRPSCEISATISLGVPDCNDINAIYFSPNENAEDAKEILLNPGDLCLYRGCDLYHWRKPFTQKWYLQAFLHYVDANGPHTDWIYDRRPYLAMSKPK